MMQRLIYAASALLILQICLAVAFNTSDNSLENAAPGSPFATFKPDTVSTIDITGDKAEHLVLERTKSGWIIPSYFSAPASSMQVEELLNKLVNAKKGFIVATTKEAAKRFKTAEDDFERHIIIKQGTTSVSDFFIGTSAGFRHSHARISGQDEIMSIPISSYQVAADVDEWLDKNLVKQEKSKLKQIEFNDISLIRNEKEWQAEGVSTEKTNKDELTKFIDKICNLTIQSVADPGKVASLFDSKPEISFTFTTNDDTRVSYSLVKQEDHHVLKTSSSELYLKVSNWQLEDLTAFTLEKLSLETETQQEDAPPVEKEAESK